jgi:hypothetical protein
MKMCLPLLPVVLMATSGSGITISTKDSLELAPNIYTSILFTAKTSTKSEVPLQYHFTESGQTPPGMIFESYPCNKPGQTVCPSIASSDGIYLDGVPGSSGSYTVTITAIDVNGDQASKTFTIRVR